MDAPDAEGSPHTLSELCLQYCVSNKNTFCEHAPLSEKLVLKSGVTLPSEFCESLIQRYTADGRPLDDNFMHIFKDHLNTHLRRINVQDSNLTEEGLLWLLPHKPVELNISGLRALSNRTLKAINQNGKNLIKLFIGDSIGIFDGVEIREGSEGRATGDARVFGGDYLFDCPDLRAFSVHGLDKKVCAAHDIIATALHPFPRLSYLDLSSCHIDVEFMDCLEALQSLQSLILYNVPISNISEAFQVIAKLKNLRSLDLSQASDDFDRVMYTDPEQNLQELVANLPALVNLDLSGTNLAGLEPLDDQGEVKENSCPIPGLEGRHFDFLGLLNCAEDASRRRGIPATKVTGEDTGQQIVLACQTYLEKRMMLQHSLEHLTSLCEHTSFSSAEGMMAILTAMQRHARDRNIQLCGSAGIFYMLRNELNTHRRSTGVYKLMRKILKAILDAMENHNHRGVLRNGVYCINNLDVPKDIIQDYDRLVSVLLTVIGRLADEHNMADAQRRCIGLLNHLACQVDGDEKDRAGELGAIDVMLLVITKKLAAGGHHDQEILDDAWSTMWNYTDETPKNCEKFFDGDGMGLFVKCLETYPNRIDLLRNMMGLMGNVAEVKYLRPRLMKTIYLEVFCDLLDTPHDDGIEVSYNACGVLAHVMSDGAEAWTVAAPAREDVEARMNRAISRWQLDVSRNINYRSFGPILRLLPEKASPESQHWAVWALSNLTRVYPHKYCQILQDEGGLTTLQSLVKTDGFTEPVKKLAEQLVAQCRSFLNDDSE